MAQCRNCGRKGLFLAVDQVGLCGNCAPSVIPVIVQTCKDIEKFGKDMQRRSNFVLALPKFEKAIADCEVLIPYWRKGILTDFNPIEHKAVVQKTMEQVIAEHITELEVQARQKWANGNTDATKMSGYMKALEKLHSLIFKVGDASVIEIAIQRMQRELDDRRYELHVRKAKAALAIDQPKKAISILVDAMLAMQHDQTPDEEQQRKMSAARNLIVQLGGRPPY